MTFKKICAACYMDELRCICDRAGLTMRPECKIHGKYCLETPSMNLVDLNEVERQYSLIPIVPLLIAELRAARIVIKAAIDVSAVAGRLAKYIEDEDDYREMREVLEILNEKLEGCK